MLIQLDIFENKKKRGLSAIMEEGRKMKNQIGGLFTRFGLHEKELNDLKKEIAELKQMVRK